MISTTVSFGYIDAVWRLTPMRGLSNSAPSATSTPEDHRLAAVRAAQALEDLDRRGLARAVRPEQPEDLARGDVEIDPVDGDQVAVALDQPANPDDRPGGDRSLGVHPWHGDGSGGPSQTVGAYSRSLSKPPDQSMSSAMVPVGSGLLGRRRTELQVGRQGNVEPDVVAGRLGQQPLLLEHVAIRLERVPGRPDGRAPGSPGWAAGRRASRSRPPPRARPGYRR